jgi:hypothetical protein
MHYLEKRVKNVKGYSRNRTRYSKSHQEKWQSSKNLLKKLPVSLKIFAKSILAMLNCLACIEKLHPEANRSGIFSVLIEEIAFCEVL